MLKSQSQNLSSTITTNNSPVTFITGWRLPSISAVSCYEPCKQIILISVFHFHTIWSPEKRPTLKKRVPRIVASPAASVSCIVATPSKAAYMGIANTDNAAANVRGIIMAQWNFWQAFMQRRWVGFKIKFTHWVSPVGTSRIVVKLHSGHNRH